jgi:hypothetical protein
MFGDQDEGQIFLDSETIKTVGNIGKTNLRFSYGVGQIEGYKAVTESICLDSEGSHCVS